MIRYIRPPRNEGEAPIWRQEITATVNAREAIGSTVVDAEATDLASVIALCNQLRAALIANGIVE